jgi:hypothetical protein
MGELHIYAILEGQIAYRVYVVCRRENTCMFMGYSKVNHVSSFSRHVHICTCL